MLIKELCDYYDQSQKTIPDYCSVQRVRYMIMLNPDGDISDIIDVRTENKKTYKKKKTLELFKIVLPKRTEKSAINSYIVEHRPLYIFGLNYDKKNDCFTVSDESTASKSHKAFVEKNLEFCKGMDSDIVKAYCEFIRKWNPKNETENQYLKKIKDSYSTSYYCFGLNGHPEIVLHKDEQILSLFKKQYEEDMNEDESQCSIEGKVLPIARIHDKIKGIKGSQGGRLVGFNEEAYKSYGKEQSYNSSISRLAMKKYTSALNTLLASENHRLFLNEITIVFFAISESDNEECDIFKLMLNGKEDELIESNLRAIIEEIKNGRKGNTSSLIDFNSKFIVAGLSPNSSRISQKFLIKNSFSFIMNNIVQHQLDMKIYDNEKQVPIWQIEKQLTSPKASNPTIPAPLVSALMLSILNGTRYPMGLLETIVRRVKTDSDEETNHAIKVNHIRVGLIKACLNRNNRIANRKEEIKMSLDKNNTNAAYLCGRLFAVLEKVQKNASKGDLNRSIKDSFFSSACTTPAIVFPKLIMLSKAHLSKSDYKEFWNQQIGSIIDSLDSNGFPKSLSLDEQGMFIVGYYQQNQELYA